MRNRLMGSILAVAAVVVFSSALLAQNAAESAAGKARMVGPTPDLSGVWSGYGTPFTVKEAPLLQPWAEAKLKAAKQGTVEFDPTLRCFPPGVPRILTYGLPMEIIQTPGRVLEFFEYDHFVRQIYTDGRRHPGDLAPTWMGDSIGRWEGATLVVDTIGFNDKTWLLGRAHVDGIDSRDLPHTEALHIVERIRRVDNVTLEYDFTIDDPKAYKKPWTGKRIYKLKPGWNIMEYVCADRYKRETTPPDK
jgi:hypothetical protein